jgi:hypothetical protein
MKRTTALAAAMAVLVLAGCAKKADKIAILGYQPYQEPYYKVGFSYPIGWHMLSEANRISVYSSADVVDRFYDLTLKGKDGARLVVSFEKMDTLKALDKVIHNTQADLSASNFDISEVKAQAVGSMPGTLIHYSGVIDAKTRLEAIQVQAVKDSFLYTVKYEAFNQAFAACRTAVDTVLATLTVPERKAKMTEEDLAKPSAVMVAFENNYLKITHPDNFEPTFPQPKAPVEFAMDVKGYRQDSYVHVDLSPAKGLTLEKVVEQNAKFFQKEQSRGEGTIDGVRAVYINYVPMKGIQSRVYFMVKNDKIYRVISNYYAAKKADYQPVFDKMVASLVTK